MELVCSRFTTIRKLVPALHYYILLASSPFSHLLDGKSIKLFLCLFFSSSLASYGQSGTIGKVKSNLTTESDSNLIELLLPFVPGMRN